MKTVLSAVLQRRTYDRIDEELEGALWGSLSIIVMDKLRDSAGRIDDKLYMNRYYKLRNSLRSL